DLTGVGEEAVHPGDALTTGGLEGDGSDPLDLLAHSVGHIGRAGQGDVGLVEVLGLEVIELVPAGDHDLPDGADPGAVVAVPAQHAHLQLTAADARLDNHLRVVLAREGDGCLQVCRVVDPGDAHR